MLETKIGQLLLMQSIVSNIPITLVFMAFFYLMVKLAKQWYYLPPGPWGLPICGYINSMKSCVHLEYDKLAKKYGSIFSVSLGSKLVVVLSDHNIIRDAFRREEFTGRPKTDFMNVINGYGIINTEGKLWKKERQFLHEKLRHFGMTQIGGKKIMESRIMREVELFLREMLAKQGAPTNVSFPLAMSISNVICSITMGYRFHPHDSKFKRFMDLIDEGFKLFSRVNFANYIPILRYLPWLRSTRNKIAQNRAEMAKICQEQIDEHEKTHEEEKPRDILDCYLDRNKKAERENQIDKLYEGKDKVRQMHQIMGDLFSAGMETVKNTLEWAIVYMLHHPKVAEEVQKELDAIVGRSRLPSKDDLDYLPYTKATIQEVLRLSNPVPLGTEHATTRDTTLNDYKIPAGTHVTALLYSVHMDPALWVDPKNFRPLRFIADDGKCFEPNFFMPFGVGQRRCLGDRLAQDELFLFFSSLMHMFNLRLPEGKPLPSLEGDVGVTVSPKPFEVCLEQRLPAIPVPVCNEANYPLRNIGS